MSNIFFISDTHFCHKNIIKYSNRPFQNVTEMDETLIANWNSFVSAEDVVYHIGDFAMGDGGRDPNKYFRRLNGKKHLIIGNHDYENPAVLELSWESVQDVKILKFKKYKLWLQHYAMRTWWHSYKDHSFQLHGHSHGELEETGDLSFDVGVDAWDFCPVPLDVIVRKMEWKLEHTDHFRRQRESEIKHKDEEGFRVLNSDLNKKFRR